MTVFDPRHPFCGQSFPLVGMTYDARSGQCCVAWLQPHEQRLIPRPATHVAFDPADIPASPLSLVAVEQLLRVVRDMQHARQGVRCHDSPPCPGGTARPEQ
jgi:hypothetical protein